jgi:hypothetical protein
MYSICRPAEFFHQKNGPKKCCDFAACCRETKSSKKLVFYLKKALSLLQKMPKTAPF